MKNNIILYNHELDYIIDYIIDVYKNIDKINDSYIINDLINKAIYYHKIISDDIEKHINKIIPCDYNVKFEKNKNLTPFENKRDVCINHIMNVYKNIDGVFTFVGNFYFTERLHPKFFYDEPGLPKYNDYLITLNELLKTQEFVDVLNNNDFKTYLNFSNALENITNQ